MKYRNLSGHVEDLSDGRQVAPLEFVELSEEDVADEYNAAKLHSGVFAKVETGEPPSMSTEKPKKLGEKGEKS